MKIEDILIMYEYHYWATAKILDAAAKVNQTQFITPYGTFGSLRGILVHLVDAEYGWRIIFQTGVVGFDLKEADFPTLNVIRQRWEEEQQAMQKYLESLTDADMTGIVRYEIEGGIVRERTQWHTLYHVVNHGTQHRSEAAGLLTEYGQSPGDLDVTVFLNDKYKLPS
jgi:uncharacterized damage-inducible protein DinB